MSANSKDSPASSTGKRLALVVGVNTTCSSLLPPLRHAIADAQAIAEVLRDKCGFELLPPVLATWVIRSENRLF